VFGTGTCRSCGATLRSDEPAGSVCAACQVSSGATPEPVIVEEQFAPTAWAWSNPAAEAALRSGRLGRILRAYRRATGLSQERLADQLGYDASYISMLETGRRTVQDVATRRHIARALAVPPHLLGVTDPADTDHVAMVAFAESTVRLAELARATGRAADAVNELWALVARLEARAADGHLEPATLAVLGRAWISLGVCLGTVLPEERLDVAAQWTGKGLTAARYLPGHGAAAAELLHLGSAMHGNELRKAGRTAAAVSVLHDAVHTARHDDERGAALALLARAAAQAGNAELFTRTAHHYEDLLDRTDHRGHPGSPLLHPFAWHEIRMRAALDLGDTTTAARLAGQTAPTTAPAPQWEVIAQVTTADVLLAAGEHDTAEDLMLAAVDGARRHRLPHQIQRVARVAHHAGHHHLGEYARATVTALVARPVLQADAPTLDSRSDAPPRVP